MGKKMARVNKLIEIIKSKNGASVRELAALMDVSEMTIRRDLKILSENGIVTNAHGSTIYNPINHIEKLQESYQLEWANEYQNAEKDRIGEFAATLVRDGETIIIDTGSTTEALARYLSAPQYLQVVCYNANILQTLLCKPNITPVFAGGYYHPNTQMFECREGVQMIKNIRANKVFVSAAGIHETLGVTCANDYEVLTKQAVLESGAEKILLVDSSKFSCVKPSYFAPLKGFDTVVTDTDLSEAWQARLEQENISLYMV